MIASCASIHQLLGNTETHKGIYRLGDNQLTYRHYTPVALKRLETVLLCTIYHHEHSHQSYTPIKHSFHVYYLFELVLILFFSSCEGTNYFAKLQNSVHICPQYTFFLYFCDINVSDKNNDYDTHH